jgi:hypothetical protein
MIQIADVEFTKPLEEAYYRNNRTSGQKSLRCFPHCNDKGHLRSSFCGSHLEVTAVIHKDGTFGDDWQNKEVLLLAEIRPFTEPRISALKSVPKSKILSELRDMRNPRSGGELVIGKVEILIEDSSTAMVKIVFNEAKHSWDYSWRSNRWSGSSASHVVDIILVESCNSALDQCDLKVYSSVSSKPFILMSSHKPSTSKKSSGRGAAKKKRDVNSRTGSEFNAGDRESERNDDRHSDETSAADYPPDFLLVKRSCYIYDIQRENEMRRKRAVTMRPYFCATDVTDSIISLPRS